MMSRVLIGMIAIWIGTIRLSSGGIYYVATNGDDTALGTSWGTALLTISNALAKAGDGDEIVVSNGLFNVDAILSLSASVTLHSVNGAEATTVHRNPAAGNFRLMTVSNVGAVVEGFTFINGYASVNGGGIYLAAGMVRNCIVVSNTSYNSFNGSSYGGGIYMTGGAVEDCLVQSNWANASASYGGKGYGGGIYMTRGFVRRCRLIANKTDSSYSLQYGFGGGIYLTGGTSENCVVINNSGPGQGGGLHVNGAGTRVFHCTVVSNSSWNANGGGLYLAAGAVSNSIIYNNLRNIDGKPNNVQQTGGTLGYSCTWPSNAGPGNITGEPGFADVSATNFNLLPGSPCIDSGVSLPGISVDIENASRSQDGDSVAGGLPDMGAWEAPPLTGDVFRCNFTTSVDQANDSLTAVLVAQVAGTATNGLYYWWDYQNDGTNDAEGAGRAVVTNTYSPGLYGVKLTVSNDATAVTTCTKLDYILVSPSTTYVALAGGNIYPYDTWEKAATGVVSALNAAADPGMVLITNGSYQWSGIPFVQGAQTVRGINGATSTVVAGNYRVSINHSNALMEGLSVVSGKGIYLYNGTVRSCHIASNYNATIDTGGGTALGGGIRMSAGLLENCRIWYNRVYNSANGNCSGGGIYMDGGIARNCLVIGNMATVGITYGGKSKGGGAYVGGGMLVNCTLSGNSVNDLNAEGGGLYVTNGVVTNTIVWKNCDSGNSYDLTEAATPSDFGGAYAVKATYSCGPELSVGLGNTISDPLFVTAGTNYGTNLFLGDYHLSKLSPCRDAGFNQAWMSLATDLDGEKRRVGDVDMGAYEALPPFAAMLMQVY